MDWKNILPQLYRGRIDSRFVPAQGKLAVGASKFGGRPDVPADFVWPVFETDTREDDQVKERPLAFLAQFDCAQLAPLDPEGLLPKEGVLSFFYELESQRWGYDPKDAGCARVFWFEGPLAPANSRRSWRRTSACRRWRPSCPGRLTLPIFRTPVPPWSTHGPPTTTASLTRPAGS